MWQSFLTNAAAQASSIVGNLDELTTKGIASASTLLEKLDSLGDELDENQQIPEEQQINNEIVGFEDTDDLKNSELKDTYESSVEPPKLETFDEKDVMLPEHSESLAESVAEKTPFTEEKASSVEDIKSNDSVDQSIQLKQDVRKLQRQLKKLEKEQSQSCAEKDRLLLENEQMKNSIKLLNEAIAVYDEEKTSILSALEVKAQYIRDQEETVSSQSERLNQLNEKISELNEINKSLYVQISESDSSSTLHSEIDRLSIELNLRDKHSKYLQLQLGEIQNECNSLKQFQKQIREASVISISSLHKELSSTLQHVSANLNLILDDISNSANNEAELHYQKQMIDELRSKYQQVIQKSKELEAEHSRVYLELVQQHKQTADELKMALETLNHQDIKIRMLEDENAGLIDKLGSKSNEDTANENTVKEDHIPDEDNFSLQALVNSLKDKDEEIHRLSAEKETLIYSYEDKMGKYAKRHEKQQKRVSELSDQKDSLLQDLQKYEIWHDQAELINKKISQLMEHIVDVIVEREDGTEKDEWLKWKNEFNSMNQDSGRLNIENESRKVDFFNSIFQKITNIFATHAIIASNIHSEQSTESMELHEQIDNLQRKYQDLFRLHSILQPEYDSVLLQNDDLNKKLKAVEENIEATENSTIMITQQHAALQESYLNCAEDLRISKQHFQDSCQQSETLRTDLQNEIREKIEELENVYQQLKNAQNDISNLENKFIRSAGDCDSYRDQFNQLTVQHDDLLNEQKKLQLIFEEVQNSESSLKQNNVSLQHDYDLLSQQIQLMNERIVKEEERWKEQSDLIQEENNRLKQQIEQWTLSKTAEKDSVDEIQMKYEQLLGTSCLKDEEIERITALITEIQQRNSELEQEVAVVREEVKEFEVKVKTETQAQFDLQEQISRYEVQYSVLQKEYIQLNEETKILHNDNKKLHAENQQLAAAQESLVREQQLLKEKYNQLSIDSEDLQQRMNNEYEELQLLNTKTMDDLLNLEKKFEFSVDELNSSKSIAQKLATELETSQLTVESYQSKCLEMERSISKYQSDLEHLRKEYDDMHASFRDIHKSFSELQTQHKEDLKIHKETVKQYDEMKMKLAVEEMKVSQLKNQLQEIKDHERQSKDSRENDFRVAEEQLKQDLHMQISQYEISISHLENKLQSSEAVIEEKSAYIVELSHTIDNQQKRVKDVEDQLLSQINVKEMFEKKKQKDLQSLKQLNDKIYQLHEQLQRKDDIVEEQASRLTTLQNDLEMKGRIIEDVTHQMQQLQAMKEDLDIQLSIAKENKSSDQVNSGNNSSTATSSSSYCLVEGEDNGSPTLHTETTESKDQLLAKYTEEIQQLRQELKVLQERVSKEKESGLVAHALVQSLQATVEERNKELQGLQVQWLQHQELFQKQLEGWKIEKSFMKDHIAELENSQTQSILSQHSLPSSSSHHSTNPMQRQRQSDGNAITTGSQDPELGDVSSFSSTLQQTFMTDKKEEIGVHPWLVSLWRLLGQYVPSVLSIVGEKPPRLNTAGIISLAYMVLLQCWSYYLWISLYSCRNQLVSH